MAQLNNNRPRLLFTVTNDLNYDQRMMRICSSLSEAGYSVLLIGRKSRASDSLQQQLFSQKRLACFFNRGFLFYAEYNLRLLWFLLFQPLDLICAIDLDTILPCLLISAIRRKKRVYDAHELFCEMKEVVSRPLVHQMWKGIEKICVPRFHHGYTVNLPIQEWFRKTYDRHYEVIMNVPRSKPLPLTITQPFILYQGAVNHGRSFETLIPAFQWIDLPLYIYGDGNFLEEAKSLVAKYKLASKVIFKGKMLPGDLQQVTPRAIMGITIFENNGLSNYYSLANRFFDYIQAGIPQLCVAYPAYTAINKEYEVAVLINDLRPEAIADTINGLLQDTERIERLRRNCLEARKKYNWEREKEKLVTFYQKLVPLD